MVLTGGGCRPNGHNAHELGDSPPLMRAVVARATMLFISATIPGRFGAPWLLCRAPGEASQVVTPAAAPPRS
jgi:hypothetical protein